MEVTSQELETTANQFCFKHVVLIFLGIKNKDLSDYLLNRDVNKNIVKVLIETQFKKGLFSVKEAHLIL